MAICSSCLGEKEEEEEEEESIVHPLSRLSILTLTFRSFHPSHLTLVDLTPQSLLSALVSFVINLHHVTLIEHTLLPLLT